MIWGARSGHATKVSILIAAMSVAVSYGSGSANASGTAASAEPEHPAATQHSMSAGLRRRERRVAAIPLRAQQRETQTSLEPRRGSVPT